VRAALVVPDDEEVLLARVALASQCSGTTRWTLGFLPRSVEVLLQALGQFGVHHSWEPKEGQLLLVGVGLGQWTAPQLALDVRGEAAVAALLLGLCVSRAHVIDLWVGPTVADLLVPLLGQCHDIESSEIPDRLGGRALRLLPRAADSPRAAGIEARDLGIFPWVKQAVLLAGLRAGSRSVFEEQFASSDHLERALLHVRAPLEAHGTCLILHPPKNADALRAEAYEHVGSIDAGLAVLAAALAAPRGELGLLHVGLNPTRTQVFSLLRGVGLDVRVTFEGARQGEPVGRVVFGWDRQLDEGSPVADQGRGACVDGEASLALGDSQLYVAALAAGSAQAWVFSHHISKIRDTDEKVWGRVVGLLRSGGAVVHDRGEGGWHVQGRSAALLPLTVTSGGDARLVLVASALALRAGTSSVIDDVECLRGTYPKWVGTLRALGAQLEIRDAD
jgi:3-phosphoshikimate 1-carboxyvinyltransferase